MLASEYGRLLAYLIIAVVIAVVVFRRSRRGRGRKSDGISTYAQSKYTLRVNAALVDLGISPSHIDPTYRRGVQIYGLRDGYNPKEAAAFILFNLPKSRRPDDSWRKIDNWIALGEVRPGVIKELENSAENTTQEAMQDVTSLLSGNDTSDIPERPNVKNDPQRSDTNEIDAVIWKYRKKSGL